MDAAVRNGGVRQRPAAQPVNPLRVHTNGHAVHHATQNDQSSTPASSSDMTGDRAKVTEGERDVLRHSSPEQLLSRSQWRIDCYVLLWLVLFRMLNALVVSRTEFAPDEHWQSVEVAHKAVFGYGWTTWEWIDRRMQDEHLLGANWGNGPIRSFLYPSLFTPALLLLKRVRLDDHPYLLAAAPCLVQALFAALTDWYMFRLASKILNERAAWASLLCSLSSTYTFHTTSRTLSNSTEAAFTMAAMYYWPLSLPEDSDSDLVGNLPLIDNVALYKSVSLFAASAALRPSNVLLSIPLFVLLLRQIARNVHSAATALEATFALLVLFGTLVTVGSASLSILFTIDSLYYRRLTFTPFGFLKRNVIQGISLFYGASPLHFYLTSALPFIGSTMLPHTLRGLWYALKKPPVSTFSPATRRWQGYCGEQDPTALSTMASATLFFLLGMSILGHKEVRFLQPIVPILHLLQGYALVLLPPFRKPILRSDRLSTRDNGQSDRAALAHQARQERIRRRDLVQALTNFTSWQGRRHLLPSPPAWHTARFVRDKMRDVIRFIHVWHGKAVLLLLFLNVLPIVYLSFHSSGQIRAAEYVGQQSRAKRLESVGFLMPCHSTPWMSHIHAEALAKDKRKAWFVTCEPPLDVNKADVVAYKDESDDLFDNPVHFLSAHVGTSERPWPSHLVMFEAFLHNHDGVPELLRIKGYAIQRTFWNSLFHLDKRRRGRVLVMQRRKE